MIAAGGLQCAALVAAFAAAALLSVTACSSTPQLDASSATNHAQWQPFQLPAKRPTKYLATTVDGRPVIEAEADNTLSLYRRRLRVEARELGSLAFSWMVPTVSWSAATASSRGPADATATGVDNAPVRLLLAFNGDHSRLSMKDRILFDLFEAFSGEMRPYATLMYLWHPHAPVESVLISERTDRLRKIVVDSGPQLPSKWHFHARNITRGFKKAFGEEPGPLISIAPMTGGNASGPPIRAYYGEVKLAAPDVAAQ